MREWQEASVWGRLHRVLLDRLGRADAIDWSRACLDSASVPAKRRASALARTRRIAAGQDPSVTSSTDANGIPLAVQLTAANVRDSRVFEELIDAVPPIRQRRGRPRRHPAKLHADKAYDVPRCREALRRRRIKCRIARRGVESSERLGRRRWVVERTLAWFSRFRRLTVRYERRADMHQAFLSLAASLICWSYVRRRLSAGIRTQQM